MPAPALKIPVQVDLDAFKQGMDKASSHVGEAVKVIGRAFTKVNGEIVAGTAGASAAVATGWAQSATSVALRFTAIGAAGVAAFKLVTSAIEESRRQLAEMVEIADKSTQRGLSPQFFQAFLLEAKKLKVEATELEDALSKAFQATKEQINPDWTVWDTGLGKVSAVAKAMQEFNFELFDASKKSRGFEIFSNAVDQSDRIRGVLIMIRELEGIGQRVAGLDLAEKFFGSQLADRMRQGLVTAQGLEESLNKAASRSDDIFPASMVKRAKEIDDELKRAHDTLDRELRPSYLTLNGILLDMKKAWVEIIELMAQGAKLATLFNPFGAPGELGRRAKEALFPRGAGSSDDAGFITAFGTISGTGIPLPRRDPRAQKDQTSDGGDSRDRFEASADAIEKRTARLEAENKTINLGTEAREKARITAELETVAKQLNGEVTEEQRLKIEKLAEAYGKAAAAIENARSPLATFARESANVGKQLNEFATRSLDGMTNELAAVVTGTKTASEAFKAMATSIINDLARIAIRQSITGPIATALFGAFGDTAFNVGGGGGVGKNAGGTNYWGGGSTWVGEQGPEIVNLPRGSQVIPAAVASRMGSSGGGNITIINNGQPSEVESKRDTPDGTEIVLRNMIYDTLGTPRAAGILRNSMTPRLR